MGFFNIFKKKNPDITLPQNPRETWIRDTHAVWSQACFGNFQHFCGLTKTSDNASQCRAMLGRDWETIGKDALLELADELIGPTDGTNFVLNDAKEVKNSDNPEEQELYGYLRRVLAWDLCRTTQILCMGYHGGWIDRETMVEKSVVACKIMQEMFESWEDLIACNLGGYADWANKQFPQEDAKRFIEARYTAYQAVKNHQNPAYLIDWNLQL